MRKIVNSYGLHLILSSYFIVSKYRMVETHFMWVRHTQTVADTLKDTKRLVYWETRCAEWIKLSKKKQSCVSKFNAFLEVMMLQCINQQPTLKLEHCTNKHRRRPSFEKNRRRVIIFFSLQNLCVFVIMFGIYGEPTCVEL